MDNPHVHSICSGPLRAALRQGLHLGENALAIREPWTMASTGCSVIVASSSTAMATARPWTRSRSICRSRSRSAPYGKTEPSAPASVGAFLHGHWTSQDRLNSYEKFEPIGSDRQSVWEGRQRLKATCIQKNQSKDDDKRSDAPQLVRRSPVF